MLSPSLSVSRCLTGAGVVSVVWLMRTRDLLRLPNTGHSGINADRMMEFFIENLVMKPASPATTSQ